MMNNQLTDQDLVRIRMWLQAYSNSLTPSSHVPEIKDLQMNIYSVIHRLTDIILEQK